MTNMPGRLLALALLALAIPVLPIGHQQSGRNETPGLEAIFDDGPLFQDQNGDGLVDYVHGHVVLGSDPSDVDVAAAANVAARIGFETSSIDLPITRQSDGVTIAVGRSALEELGISSDALGVDLEPGLGVVTLLNDVTPSTLVIAGGDNVGTAAAALAFGARAPHVWDPDGTTYADVAEGTRTILATSEVEEVEARVARIVVEHDTPGLHRLDLELRVPAGDFERAEQILREAAVTDDESTDEAEVEGQVGDEADEAEVEPWAEEEAVEDADAHKPPSLHVEGLRLLRIILTAPGAEPVVIHVTGTEESPAQATGRRPGGGDKEDLDLSNLYTTGGFFSDNDRNLIPDRVDVVLSAAGESSGATIDLAARIALEATGVTIPIALAPEEIEEPDQQAPLILIGNTHPVVEQLVEDEKLVIPQLSPGEGWIQVIPKAFEDKSTLVILGADDAGLERAVRQVAERFPHVWERGKDRTTVEDIEQELWMTLSSRSPIGQAATALYKLDQLIESLNRVDLESAEVFIHVEKADDSLCDYVRTRLGGRLRADQLTVNVDNLDVQNARQLIDDEFDVASEVDEFWSLFRSEVLPRVQSGESVTLQTLLSEPPEIRAHIQQQATTELVSAGADPATTTVTVLSAYKQGYSWLFDHVRPALSGQSIDTILIRFAEIGPPDEWPQQAMYTPTRWLLEIFPIDDVLSRDLGIAIGQVRFEKMPIGSPTYEVVATAPGGTEIYRETFDPKYVLRPYFDRFPDYEKARVTTGWISAKVGGTEVVSQRIITDIERFWDHFQSQTLMQIYDYVMRNGEGKPRATDAPHFGELRVDVSLSEPDYQIGVDKEQISSMEALHEEIYFAVLHFFDVMGQMARGEGLNFPGRVIPIVRPKSDGATGHAKITFTGFGASGPMVRIAYKERGALPREDRRLIPPVTMDRPAALSARVSAGSPGLDELGFRVQVNFERDRRAEFVLRTSARNIDGRITSAEQLTSILKLAEELREANLYRQQLAFNGMGSVGLTTYWGHEFDSDSSVVASLVGNGLPMPFPSIADYREDGYQWVGEALVQWDTPIHPQEAGEILSRMATFPKATVYQAGESYLGQRIWALDLMAPLAGSHWSQAKVSTLKPTVMYSGREHANEVSSTSHLLRLAELILADPDYEDVLDSVNVVIHPITNVDGAQLEHELHQITPDHMLHAAYLGSLGVGATSGQGDDDPIYLEAKVRPRLWNTWLPDIYMNPHGYPSHEWVQLFSEYAAWVRTRATEARSWWGMRGWFMPRFTYVNSPDFPDHKAAAFEIRDRITEKINGVSEMRELNRRAYDRYRRYAFAFDQENFKLDFADSVLIYTAITGSSGEGRGSGMSNPRVTIWSATTEAPDETAYGEWMELMARTGLECDEAVLEYLVEANHEIDRSKEPFATGMTFKVHRPRPAKSKEAAVAENEDL
jgi:hypothetical protein